MTTYILLEEFISDVRQLAGFHTEGWVLGFPHSPNYEIIIASTAIMWYIYTLKYTIIIGNVLQLNQKFLVLKYVQNFIKTLADALTCSGTLCTHLHFPTLGKNPA